jgi:predicted ATPase
MLPIVITGASGGGKSTLVAALAARGLRTQPEIGRQIVRAQLDSGGTALPWADRVAFRDLLFAGAIAAYDQHAGAPGPVFFDRSHVEALGYGALIGRPAGPEMWRMARARPLAPVVFVCPLWPEIFGSDAERRHDLAFAAADMEATLAAYRALGHALCEVPQRPVADRVAFVLARCASDA